MHQFLSLFVLLEILLQQLSQAVVGVGSVGFLDDDFFLSCGQWSEVFLLHLGVDLLDVYGRERRCSFLSESGLDLRAGYKKLGARRVIILFVFAVGSPVVDDQVDWVFCDVVI